MIAHLRGSILEKHPNRIVVDVNGVGYDVFVPLSTFYGLGEPGAAVALRIHTHVREDAFVLYGFATRLEQELFERLIGVSGIGPKVAAAIGGGAAPPDAPVLRDDVVSALVNLGYHRPLAEKAAEAAVKTIGSASDASFERALKQALREVAK